MILAVDVHYFGSTAVVAGVFFQKWRDAESFDTMKMVYLGFEDYEAGAFYKRELQPIMNFLSKQKHILNTIIIDGFVHLHKPRKGLGMHLFDQTGCPVMGIAKNPLKIACRYALVYRGKSKKPLYVSAMGFDLKHACNLIRSMHGPYRIPKLIKLADTLCRSNF